jgi:hypothetical protein
MRWTEFASHLAAGQQAELPNLLTIGIGSLALAVRLTEDHAPAGDVFRHLERAERSLRLAERLAGGGDPGRQDRVCGLAWTHPFDSMLSWHGLMAELEDAEQARMRATLNGALRDARTAGHVLLADGTLDDLHCHLRQAIEALDRLNVLRLVIARS